MALKKQTYLNSSNYNKPMVNKNFLSFLLVFTLLISFASALEEYGTFKQNDEVRLSQVCSDATYINISGITYPNGTLALSNLEMTSSGSGEFYYNFNLTEPLGRYDVRGVSDGCEGTFATYFEVTLSGVDQNMTLVIADIFLILSISFIIYILHHKYKGVSGSDSGKSISESHNGNWGRTFIKTAGNNFMRNSFLWYYSLGWLLLIVFRDLVYNFNGAEIYNFFVLGLNIYAIGFFFVIATWIGILIHHFMFITELINDLDLGVER